MAYFGSSFADSPVLAISPQTAHQAIALSRTTYTSEPLSMNAMSCGSQSLFHHNPPPQRPSGAGRKRSRDEAEPNLAEDLPQPIPSEPVQKAGDDWMYGEAMVLTKPGSGHVANANSQLGAWAEKKASTAEGTGRTEARTVHQRQLEEQRPSLRSHKSQRLEQIVASSPDKEHSAPSPSSSVSNLDTRKHPVVDDFTLHLGIGWRRISEDEDIQAAARGWAKYIENHFPISNVSIHLESRGLQSYLVQAAEGFFLFDENLRQGRLVSSNGEGALQNLKSNPPTFDGTDIMTAMETPKLMERTNTPLFSMDMEVC